MNAFAANASLDGAPLDDRGIRDAELARARHALAYLKDRIGNEGIRDLLAGDVEASARQARAWVEAAGGRWRRGVAELVVPGPPAADFHCWYERAMTERREAVLRSGHPEHFVLSPENGGVEVIENVGETDLPWRIFYRALPGDAFPTRWDADYPVRFGAEIVDRDGLRVGYTMHQAHDAADGMHLHMRTLRPEAAPKELVDRHLRHLAIEVTDWTRAAWLDRKGVAA